MSEFNYAIARRVTAGLTAASILLSGCGSKSSQEQARDTKPVAAKVQPIQPNERQLHCLVVDKDKWIPVIPPVLDRSIIAGRLGIQEDELVYAKFGGVQCAEGVTFDEAEKGMDAVVKGVGHTCLVVRVNPPHGEPIKANTYYHDAWATCLPDSNVSLAGMPEA